MPREADISLAVCICTMNRAQELDGCLASLRAGTRQPAQIIVSDDSDDPRAPMAVCARHGAVIHQRGPRRGLAANRNACLRTVSTSHVLFIDDDVRVPPDFVQRAWGLASSCEPRTIVTGYEINHLGGKARKVTPHAADFLGFQHVPIRGECRAIVINATLFPRRLFDQARFDPRLRYGCEEIDIARHALALGYRIGYCDNLFVEHFPSPTNRDRYGRLVHASRLYATAKAYWAYERSLSKTLAYCAVAPLHLLASAARQGRPAPVVQALAAIVQAKRYAWEAATART